ncbi:MAG: hypothetical protein R3246_01165 [Acidimicrobiia bacterium]|nr:hypothetical protein [Acidimicrobiia bacterium]
MDATEVAHAQLARMRGMNASYHQRFFSDIRFTILTVVGLFVVGAAVDRRLYLLVPVVALVGACQTAFDASYLIFSRQYSTRLEQYINRSLGHDVLVAHRMEDEYLFPLDTPKLVTVGVERFSWFGFMTLLYTAVGVGAYAAGVWASLGVIGSDIGLRAGGIYLVALAVLTIAALATGVWWFPGGEGERRLRRVLDAAFPSPPPA